MLRPWKPRPGEWNDQAATHLLRRAGFGPKQGQVRQMLELGLSRAVETVLTTDTHAEDLYRGIEPLLAQGEVSTLQAWWMALILAGGAPLRERTALCWHNHFATSFDKVDDVRLMHRQNELFRREGLGDFRRLLHAVTQDTAMLLWLDGGDNRKSHPNENFAREVMELFGLGIGNYTEDDVLEAARGLTGWGTRGRSSVFREKHHDAGTKKVLGMKGALGAADVIDAVLDHPACARHVAHRLLKEFVAPRPRQEWVDALAEELVSNRWDIGATLATLFASTLFFSDEVRRVRIASPVELMAFSVRALGVPFAPKRAAQLCAEMGQALFRPPNVKGWDGHEAWVNVGTWIARHNAMVEVAEAKRSTIDSDAPRHATAEAMREELLANVPTPQLDDAVGRALAEAADTPTSMAVAAALVLTSPEFHLV